MLIFAIFAFPLCFKLVVGSIYCAGTNLSSSFIIFNRPTLQTQFKQYRNSYDFCATTGISHITRLQSGLSAAWAPSAIHDTIIALMDDRRDS